MYHTGIEVRADAHHVWLSLEGRFVRLVVSCRDRILVCIWPRAPVDYTVLVER